MKAIWMERPGPPEVLRYVEVPTPEAAPGQVLVRAHSIPALSAVVIPSGW